MLTVVNGINESDVVIAVDAHSNVDAGLVLRYQDRNNYVAGLYSASDKAIYLVERKDGVTGRPLGHTPVSITEPVFRLTAEVRGGMSIVSLKSQGKATATPIVAVANINKGRVGLMCSCLGETQTFEKFEVRQSPALIADDHLEKRLYDASGNYRGELTGPGDAESVDWDDYGKEKHLLLDAYRPERLPMPGDWLLVMAVQ